MKSLKKRTHVKKQRQLQRPNMSGTEQKDAPETTSSESSSTDTIVLDLGSSASSAFGHLSITDPFSCHTNSTISTITLPSTCYSFTGTQSTLNWTGGSYSYTPSVNITTDGISMEKGSDIKIGGKSLVDAIEKIEERLAILKPNPALEDRWDQLKELRRQYQELEKELLEKEKMWDILKKT